MNKVSYLLGITTITLAISPLLAEAQTVETIEEQSITVEVIPVDISETQPIPGTIATSVEGLFISPQNNSETQTNSENIDLTIAQRDIDRGRLTRQQYSYIGAGLNVGFDNSGSTPIEDTGFAINGKVAFTPNISLRPAIIFADDTAFLIPLTYDFTIRGADPFDTVPFTPFLGGGIAVTTDDDDSVGFLLSGGFDYRLSKEFVANAGLNVGFIDDSTDVGLLLSIGYIFPGF